MLMSKFMLVLKSSVPLTEHQFCPSSGYLDWEPFELTRVPTIYKLPKLTAFQSTNNLQACPDGDYKYI